MTAMVAIRLGVWAVSGFQLTWLSETEICYSVIPDYDHRSTDKTVEICHQTLLLSIIWKAGINPKPLWAANNDFFV